MFNPFTRCIESTGKNEWLYENEPMSPRLMAMIIDLRTFIDRHAEQRKHKHCREWL